MWFPKRVRTYRVSLCAALLGVFAQCLQVRATEMVTQYSVTAWGHKDGLPSTFIYAIAQTDDGFLWLGTADGLVRFDGEQFTPWRFLQADDAPLGPVRALRASSHGGLWLGTRAGMLGRIRDDQLTTVSLHSAVESIEEASDGSLWVAASTALWHLDGTNLTPIQPPIEVQGGWLSGPLEGDDGTQWITTLRGVFHVDAQNRLKLAGGRASWLFRTRDGRLNLLDESGRVRSPGSEKTIWQSSDGSHKPLAVSAAISDGDGSLWIASFGNGISRLAPPGGGALAERFMRKDGLSSDFVRFLFEDREHNLWVATENGLDRLRRNNALSFTRREGLLSDTVTSIATGTDGSVWLGTSEGLERQVGGKRAAYLHGTRILSLLMDGNRQLWAGTTHGLMQRRDGRIFSPREDAKFLAITALAEDAAGTLWFYDTDRGLFRQQRGRAAEAVTDNSLLHQTVTAMYGGHDGEVWFGMENGNMVAYRKGEFHAYSTQDGLSGGEVHGLSEGAAGELWVATGRGLCFFTGQRFDCRNMRDGLPGDRVLWTIPDTNGDMWLGYNIGVARLDLQELHRAEAIGAARLRDKLFDDGDGIEYSPDLGGNAPAAFAQDGRLWLTTSQGVAVLDPAHLRTNLLPPPVHILELKADGQEIDLSRPIRLQPLTRNIQFSFTGLSLSDVRKMRFRYKLDGFDREWRDGGSHRDASYTNLPPRRYVFRVCAANNDGVWNDTGARLDFSIAPAYFQTVWFRLLCIGAALMAAAIVFRVRLRSAQRNMRLRYEERMEERTRIAQELHDHLIQEMVGIGMQLEVAHELTKEDAGAKRPLERALSLSRSAIASGRLTLQSLRSRPVTGRALMDMLRSTADAYAQVDRVPVEYLVEGDERQLSPEIVEDVSEIGQEALRNALKHAGDGAITVRLHFGGESFDLSVRDEGAGIDDVVLRRGVPGHYGLVGMRERAARMPAEFTIQSAPGRGTTVHISVPAIRAYQNDTDADAGEWSRWPLRRLFRRWTGQGRVK